jgi:hypothetical protein
MRVSDWRCPDALCYDSVENFLNGGWGRRHAKDQGKEEGNRGSKGNQLKGASNGCGDVKERQLGDVVGGLGTGDGSQRVR